LTLTRTRVAHRRVNDSKIKFMVEAKKNNFFLHFTDQQKEQEKEIESPIVIWHNDDDEKTIKAGGIQQIFHPIPTD
jgi:hypothetical protein